MKTETKMILMVLGLVLFGGLTQYRYGNNGTWIIAGLMVFSIGFGWYAGLLREKKLKK